jgi:hypothetical protein
MQPIFFLQVPPTIVTRQTAFFFMLIETCICPQLTVKKLNSIISKG